MQMIKILNHYRVSLYGIDFLYMVSLLIGKKYDLFTSEPL